jgi:hypothetical protein
MINPNIPLLDLRYVRIRSLVTSQCVADLVRLLRFAEGKPSNGIIQASITPLSKEE